MPDPVQVAFKRIKQPKVGENGYGTVYSLLPLLSSLRQGII